MVKSNYEERQVRLSKKNNEIINRIITKIVSVFFITITAFYPLFLGYRGYFRIPFDKALFFWITSIIAICTIFFMFISVKGKFDIDNYYIDDEPLRRITIAELAVLSFTGWTLISAIASVVQNPEWANFGLVSASVWFGANNRYEGFISFLGYAICFVLIARFYKPNRLHLLFVAVSTILVSLYGVLQFFGVDIFSLFHFNSWIGFDNAGIPYVLYGNLTAPFRTTLGNVNIVSAYCSFMIMLFTVLFSVSRSKWQYLYLVASACSFALSLTTGLSGDAHTVAILGSMILLIPYWISNRARLGRILIVLSSWCIVYAGYSTYISAMKRQYEAGVYFPHHDQHFLNSHTSINIFLILIFAGALIFIGLTLILLLKKWPETAMKTVGVICLPAMLISGLIGLEVMGSRLSDQPDNIIWQAREIIHGRLDDDFGSYRGWIWRNAFEVIPENPILGSGPGTFYHALGTERQAEAEELYRLRFDKAHNVFLQIAVCMGIPALIAYLIFLFSVFIPAIKHAFKRPILLAFGAAALSYIIQSFFMVELPITTPLLWIALGVMASEVWMAKIGYKNIEV